MRPLAISLLLLAGATTGCDHFYTVRGTVARCADVRPLPGAIVHLSDGRKQGFTTTGQDGRFEVSLNQPGDEGASTLTVAKAGYVTATHQVERANDVTNVCLEPAGQPAASRLTQPSRSVEP